MEAQAAVLTIYGGGEGGVLHKNQAGCTDCFSSSDREDKRPLNTLTL